MPKAMLGTGAVNVTVLKKFKMERRTEKQTEYSARTGERTRSKEHEEGSSFTN